MKTSNHLKRAFSITAALLLLPLTSATAEQPNIIFIFADDWGYADMSKHGSTFCQTPHMDQMAEEGIDFSNFTVNSPVCTPSRVAVMTGQFPARHSIHQHFQGIKAHIKRGMPDWLDPQATMLPRLLQQAGYKTGHFGKWHLGSVNDSPTEDAYGYHSYATFNGSGKNEIPKGGLSSVTHTEKFIRETHKENPSQPFFINLWLHEVHTPHLPVERYMEKFKHLPEAQQVYAAVIAEGDEAVGRIFALLKELSIDQNTLVVFSTDNGPEHSTDDKGHKGQGLGKFYSVGETGGLKGEKRSLFAGGIRVPFIVRWPAHTPKGKIDTTSVVTAVDLLPTFLAAAGVELPKEYAPDGENVLAAFKGTPIQRTKPIFWEWRGGANQEFTWPSIGMREGKWKLLVNKKTNQAELYDLVNDWKEQKNLASENPEIVLQLTQKIDSWKATLPLEPSPNALSAARSKDKKDKPTKKEKKEK
ncbi:MAG: sulfatase family protein [Akkermansiaceae bacterium]